MARFALALVLLSLSASASRGFDLLLSIPGEYPAFGLDQFPHTDPQDFDGDGLPEILTLSAADTTLTVRNLGGTVLWTYRPGPSDIAAICPTCGPEWTWYSAAFAECDQAPGRELVFQWQAFASGQRGLAVVSSTTGSVLETVPAPGGIQERGRADFNGDGSDEIVLKSSSSVEIWGDETRLGTAAPARVPPTSSNTGVRIYPSPSTGSAAVELSLASPAQVDAAVYDVAGRLVGRLGGGALPAGNTVLQWDGRSTTGEAVVAGRYFVRVTVNGEHLARSVVLLR